MISILVPIYSVEKFIHRCAVSLFCQTYKDIEYIFVNDCTPDNSINILKDVISQYPYRKPYVRIINHDTNKGISAVRNTCINNATGDYVLFVDSDDYLEIDAVEKLVNAQINSDSDIVTGQAVIHKANCEYILSRPHFYSHRDFINDMLQLSINHTIWGRLIKKSLFTDFNIHTLEGANFGDDMQLMSQLSYYAKKYISINDVIYHYDNTNPSSYLNSSSNITKNTERYIKRTLQDISSVKYVYDFFQERDKEFLQSLKKNLVYLYKILKVQYCSLGNKEKYYFTVKNLRCLENESRNNFVYWIKGNYYIYKLWTNLKSNTRGK